MVSLCDKITMACYFREDFLLLLRKTKNPRHDVGEAFSEHIMTSLLHMTEYHNRTDHFI